MPSLDIARLSIRVDSSGVQYHVVIDFAPQVTCGTGGSPVNHAQDARATRDRDVFDNLSGGIIKSNDQKRDGENQTRGGETQTNAGPSQIDRSIHRHCLDVVANSGRRGSGSEHR